MPDLKVSDVSKGATLLKRLLERADTNQDGAIRTGEIDTIAPGNPRVPAPKKQTDLRSAIWGVTKYGVSKGSVQVKDLQAAVDQFARNLKAADKDGDGTVTEKEQRSLSTLAERRFADFVASQGRARVSDFKLEPQKLPRAPRFSWSGSISAVTSSLLAAYSDPKNDNFWPRWGSPAKGASRYVLTRTEAANMVKALKPLYVSRQKGVIAELSARTTHGDFGCVSCDAGARTVFQAYARSLGVSGLEFKAPAAPRMPGP